MPRQSMFIEATVRVRGIQYKISAEDVETTIDIAEGLKSLDQMCPYCDGEPEIWFVPAKDGTGNVVKLQCRCGAGKKLIHKLNGALVAPSSVETQHGKNYSTDGWEFYDRARNEIELRPLPVAAKPAENSNASSARAAELAKQYPPCFPAEQEFINEYPNRSPEAVKVIGARQVGYVPLTLRFRKATDKFLQNKWGNCPSVSVGNAALAIINQLLALHKDNVRDAVPFYEWTWAAIRCGVQNRPGTNGSTIAAAMKAVNDYGILFIDDLNESDKQRFLNSEGIQMNGATDWCKSMRNWKSAFEKYGDIASRYQIKTTKPNSWQDIEFALQHGCSISYGTDIKLVFAGFFKELFSRCSNLNFSE